MSHDHEHHHHEHEHEGAAEGDLFGMAIGFRIFEDEGTLYAAEVEVTSYVDDPDALGATLVFHSLDGLDPLAADVSTDDTWATDIDDELTRDETAPLKEQAAAILRQVAGYGEPQLREYLVRAREETAAAREEEEGEAEGEGEE